jgi:ankyrin repeat protein
MYKITSEGCIPPGATSLAEQQNYDTECQRVLAVYGDICLVYESDPDEYFAPRIPTLCAAIYEDDLKAVKVLLENGADPNEPGEDGRNALNMAAFVGLKSEYLFNKILAKIKDVNTYTLPCHHSWTSSPPLIEAVACENLHIVVWLMKHPDIDVNVLDSNNETALHMAVDRDHPAIVAQLLSDKRVDDSFRNNNGKTALEKAHSYCKLDCFNILWKNKSLEAQKKFSEYYKEKQVTQSAEKVFRVL